VLPQTPPTHDYDIFNAKIVFCQKLAFNNVIHMHACMDYCDGSNSGCKFFSHVSFEETGTA
jgi:hypothetical protein